MNEFPTVRPEQRVNHPVFGDDPFLTFVSQNEGGVTGLLRDEVFSRIEGAERTRNVLSFKYNEWMGSVNNVLIKKSCKHTERRVSKRRSRRIRWIYQVNLKAWRAEESNCGDYGFACDKTENSSTLVL